MAIQLWVAEGVARAADELSETHAVDSRIQVDETRCCTLGNCGPDGWFSSHDDVTAGVLLSFHGPLSGDVLLCMEPEQALAWSQAGSTSHDLVRTYVDLASGVLNAVVKSAAEELDVATESGVAELVEMSAPGCLIQTHAPSDTVVVCSRLRIRAGRQHLTADLYLLLDPKLMSAMLGALSVSAH